MTDSQDPWVQDDALAEDLHILRQRTGMSGKQFAAALGWAPSKVSRIENRKQMPSRADVDDWAAAASATLAETRALRNLLDKTQTVQRAWKRRIRQGQAAIQADYNAIVAGASIIRHFEMTAVPGLFQTAGYARRILTEMADLAGVPFDPEAVTARLERSRHLADSGKQFVILLAEPVLRWGLCSADVMAEQLHHLLAVMDQPNVELGILPLDVPLTTAPQLSFQIYGDIAIVETVTTELVYRDDLAATYETVFNRLWRDAAIGDDARRLIIEAINALQIKAPN